MFQVYTSSWFVYCSFTRRRQTKVHAPILVHGPTPLPSQAIGRGWSSLPSSANNVRWEDLLRTSEEMQTLVSFLLTDRQYIRVPERFPKSFFSKTKPRAQKLYSILLLHFYTSNHPPFYRTSIAETHPACTQILILGFIVVSGLKAFLGHRLQWIHLLQSR